MKKTSKISPRKLILRAQTVAVMALSEKALRERVVGGWNPSTSACCSGGSD